MHYYGNDRCFKFPLFERLNAPLNDQIFFYSVKLISYFELNHNNVFKF